MAFDWDPDKGRANRDKHGIGFEEAQCIFNGPVLTRVDNRQAYGEQRFISIGALSPEAVIVVVHTERNGTTRLISARKANRHERRIYNDHIEQTHDRY